MLILVTPLYWQAPSNISMLMAVKMEKISLECSRAVTGLSSGSFNTLEPIQAIHIALDEALLMVKKSLLLNIKVGLSPLSTQELY
jgi:hypothetical protein